MGDSSWLSPVQLGDSWRLLLLRDNCQKLWKRKNSNEEREQGHLRPSDDDILFRQLSKKKKFFSFHSPLFGTSSHSTRVLKNKGKVCGEKLLQLLLLSPLPLFRAGFEIES